MNVIAVDDEPIALEIISNHASKVPFVNLQATFTNAFDAIAYLQQHKIDLIFLDIKMPDISGIDFVKTLSKAPMIVFTTAYSEHAVQSFELDAVDYLLKPFSVSRFLKACNKAKELFDLRKQNDQKTVDHIFLKDGYEQVKIMLDDVLYIEADGNYSKVHLENGKLLTTRVTINNLADLLPLFFIRVHRTYIVSKPKIDRFDKYQVVVKDTIIPIGASYADSLK